MNKAAPGDFLHEGISTTPIRVEFWTGDGLHDVGNDLAMGRIESLPAYRPIRFEQRLRANQDAVLANYISAMAASTKKEILSPAGEWLIDNHHIVEESFRHLRRDLAPKMYARLPILTIEGTTLPRVLALCWVYVATTNSELHEETLSELVHGFQTAETLTIAELWAVPALMRFVLLENLRRLSDRVERSRALRRDANALADSIAANGIDISKTLAAYEDKARFDAFSAQFLYRMRDGSAASDRALRWLEVQVRATGGDPGQVVASDEARQSSGNVTVGNIIRSLRTSDEIDWLDWFEGVSKVDEVLRRDPIYGRLEKQTRNSYRTAVERLSRRSGLTEIAVADLAIDATHGGPHVGALLVGGEQARLEQACGYNPTPREAFGRSYRRLGWLGAAGPQVLVTLLIAWSIAAIAGSQTQWQIVMFVLALLPASEAAAGLVHIFMTRFLRPQHIPALDFTDGVPDNQRTLVVVPCLLTGRDDIDVLVGTLELHHLSNQPGAISFALLSDWIDSDVEETDADRALLDYARARIEELSSKYAASGEHRFHLLHRRRTLNDRENVWMGWERKRGKLIELNRFLLGDPDTSLIAPDFPQASSVRYVLTLDADTRLPRGTVHALVGKMAHPVNRPVIDLATGAVVEGYAVMQPRVTPSLTTGQNASLFQRIFSTDRGLDPYVFTVSDLYQDLLGEGSYTGKAIYDVRTFEAAVGHRLPENLILSHDLVEGSLARTALVSDVQVVEDFPVSYLTDSARQHRWVRGDWQLLPIIFSADIPLNGVGRLKMIDNLRRSLVPPSWIAASVAGWLFLPDHAAIVWQLLLVATMMIWPIMAFNAGLLPSQPSVSSVRHLRTLAREGLGHLTAVTMRLCLLAHMAVVMVDAILRSSHRTWISGRNMLQWNPASAPASAQRVGLSRYAVAMASSVGIGAIAFGLVLVFNPQNIPVAAILCLLWVAAPAVAWRASQTLSTEDDLTVSTADAAELRRIARVTWRFFEEYVTADTNHLPPDNLQIDPELKLARRTSPTNIGLYLLSIVSARDFGWISLNDAIRRISLTLETVERMEKHKGHLYNWYDTTSLELLPPAYVSSVDSGNFAGHLITVSSALATWARNPLVHRISGLQGLNDTLGVLRDCLGQIPDDRAAIRPLRQRLDERIAGFEKRYTAALDDPALVGLRAINLTVIANDISMLASAYDTELGGSVGVEVAWWAGALVRTCNAINGEIEEPAAEMGPMAARLSALAEQARGIAFSMDFGFLMNPQKRLLSIGFRADTNELDQSCYDLLASEARLASFFAIAKGDIPKEHWFRLARPVTAIGSHGVLLSWSGSMFEYLMAPLVMRERSGSILNQSSAAAVAIQIDQGRRHSVPWGVSESAFNGRDSEMNYQYYAFGEPTLALKRSYSEDIVIAPYASILAAQVAPDKAMANLRRLKTLKAFGKYGYYDAIDFTRKRVPETSRHAIVYNVMAHHHGMSIVSIANVLMKGIHRDRFHSDPVIEAAELLLQEKSPREIVPITQAGKANDDARDLLVAPLGQTVVLDPASGQRALGLLSNGTYTKMITATGGGYSRIGRRAVTRWLPDPLFETDGAFVFLRDRALGAWWSTTTAPKQAASEVATTIISDHKVEFFKTAHGIDSHLQTIVATESNAEGYRLTLTNTGDAPRVLDATTYGEIVLTDDAADRAHPAFSKMFVETSIERNGTVVIARRNARMRGDTPLYLGHVLCGGSDAHTGQAETDRRAFVGRGRTLGTAAAMDRDRLEGHAGYTLDPIFSLRREINLQPGKPISVTFWTIVAETEDELRRALAHYCHAETFDHEQRLAWSRSQVQLRHLDTSLAEAEVFRKLAAHVIYPSSALATQDQSIRADLAPQSELWGLGLSGDRPFFVLRIDIETDLPILQTALRMQEYFIARGVGMDLVVINERDHSYVDDLQGAITLMVDTARSTGRGDRSRNETFTLRRDQMPPQMWRRVLAAARVVLHARNGKLGEQLTRIESELAASSFRPAPSVPTAPRRRVENDPQPFDRDSLLYPNGLGGFSEDGREYVVHLAQGERTPHPWINVIAREDFGFHVSAEGTSYTWAANSRDYQITPWSNDPVIDRPGEAIYICDRNTGAFATPFAAVSEDSRAIFETRHGLGYSIFRSRNGWLDVDAVQTLDRDHPAKITRLTLTNTSDRQLSLDVANYLEPILGNDRAKSATTIQSRLDAATGALVLTNPFSGDFQGRATVMASSLGFDWHTASRAAFFGPEPDLARPAAMAGVRPASTTRTDADPCGAIVSHLLLEPRSRAEIVFALIDTVEQDVAAIIADILSDGRAEITRVETEREWSAILDTLQVETPDRSFDLLVNTWLPYQNLGCRIRARSAFYQASGAFGFRDQLQDTGALILQDPSLARRQILNAAGRQFRDGDVQHWWLPKTGAGVRTTISDDVVWLAHMTARYLRMTGDGGILNESIAYLEGPEIPEGHSDKFFVPDQSSFSEPLYEHCVRALTLAIKRTGQHGLPLILGGDWNDGMNRVGEEGLGESVWLGFFLYDTLAQFEPLARARGDSAMADRFATHRDALRTALNDSGWDGAWFRRGFFDDGTPLGSDQSDECRIDSIAQSWAALSGAADGERASRAVDAALGHLADENAGILRLFSPPFASTHKEPGYIKAYPPGVRENGGQYTHAAIWLIYALARMGRGSDAYRMFSMLNPIHHSDSREAAETYRVEPYVIAADVYGAPDKLGRGGWTWYTGSAGWMYRAAVEGILGIALEDGTHLRITPALPDHWPSYTAQLRLNGASHRIEASRRGDTVTVKLDGRGPDTEGRFVLS
ncbi:GH36-type glycosyl hydrolase domain-containing protein [Pseudoroseicyclus aestuarii]|uniref:Cyclic beta-1,2-glucan synthase n=1 Tax=Pseudoroseicyclus aestuarii TaxID=1795041 RepID=A0A318SSI0_9RHOB|nr:glucoamylase family protein [Pseudoroseicyclus aestuarii]PYE80840.1 cyclic beta-1,2-glucan synthase [Pseudoroseicyclus aestuarii]